MPRLSPTTIALIAGVLLLLAIVLFLGTGRGGENQDRLSDNQVGTASADDPEKRCSSQATYDLIKRELFRRAAQVRGSDQAAFDRLAAYSVLRMDAPMLRSEDEDLGAVTCTGSLALDLPPGVAVVGGRRTLTADITYALQPAADRSGNVLTLTNADAIITPLATLARAGAQPGLPQQQQSGASDPMEPLPDFGVPPSGTATPPPPQAIPPQRAPQAPTPPADDPPQQTSARPSFNCANARTRGELAVCSDSGLASLDRQMSSQYFRAVSRADEGQRIQLQRTRNRFLAYRDRCRSDACIADAYRGRMQEIADIMAR